MSLSGPVLVPSRRQDRITAIDALRGTALIGLFLLHALEHFNVLIDPPSTSTWLKLLDSGTDDLIYFLFSGKAFGIFALMFGVSFSLILGTWWTRESRAIGRFLWRLSILAVIGCLHSVIYCGDILTILAVLGAPLVLVYRWGDRAILTMAVVLLVQPPTMCLVGGLLGGLAPPSQPYHWHIYNQLTAIYAHGTLLDVLRANLWQGQLARFWFTIETGRYLQMAGLFLVGLVIGRDGTLTRTQADGRLLEVVLLCGSLGFLLLFPLKRWAEKSGFLPVSRYEIVGLAEAYCSLAQIAIWTSGFMLLYPRLRAFGPVKGLAAMGRTSLTCYVMQSVVCVPLFYGYGLGLYRFMGPFYSVSLGVAVAAFQGWLASLWLQHFRYGPLEWLWRAATFRTLALPFRLGTASSETTVLPTTGLRPSRIAEPG